MKLDYNENEDAMKSESRYMAQVGALQIILLQKERTQALVCADCQKAFHGNIDDEGFVRDRYRYGWRFQDGGVYCPKCANDESEENEI